MTPPSVADFMASLFSDVTLQTFRVLDPGAGKGALTRAFLERVLNGRKRPAAIELTAFELDPTFHTAIDSMLEAYATSSGVRSRIVSGDFIEHAVERSLQGLADYTHAIINPPYKKINTDSDHRRALREVGIETVNLYSAFVALALNLLQPGGQLVAIVPRSFCNGPYYKPFRRFILDRAAIRRMHLFGSRTEAFKSDDVLQENLIVVLERGGKQGAVDVSTSTGDSFSDLATNTHPFDRIVLPNDPEYFIHVPTSTERHAIELSQEVRHSLTDLRLKVSTGPVVDFRLRDHTRDMPERGSVPLLYPTHFAGQDVKWPKPGIKKPNAIQRNSETERWLYPTGFYCVVRRFSSKEEKRRIVASVVDPAQFPDAAMLGFENHLNVFHEDRGGLPEDIARGLAVFLNSTAVDEFFRRFNGHTQVNATDLKLMKYPSRAALSALGKWGKKHPRQTQEMIDAEFNKISI